MLSAPLVTEASPEQAGEIQSEREARLAAPEAVVAREASRTLFEGLSGSGAVSLAEKTFGIEHPTWTPPGSSAGEGHVTKYVGDDDAAMVSPSGAHLLVASTVPLRRGVGSGQLAPTSLTLHEHEGSYVPASPVVPVSISKTAGAGVSLPLGISFAPVQAATPEASVVVGDRVVYPGTATDTDFMLEPAPGGVEASWQLLSEASAQENGLAFKLPAGASLQLSKSVPGGAEVLEEGQVLAVIPPATAREANGSTLAVSYSISGSTLMTHVNLGGSVAFPVEVDPIVEVLYGGFPGATGVWQGWTFESNCGCFSQWGNSTLRGTGSAAGSYPAGDFGQWYVYAPGAGQEGGASIARVDIRGVAHYQNGESALVAFIADAPNPSYTFNGFYPEDTRWGPYSSTASLAGQAMTFCADGVAGGYEGGPNPLCNESYGGEYFAFADDTQGNQASENYVDCPARTCTISTNTPPNHVVLDDVQNGWVQYGPGSAQISAEDQGVGIEALAVEIPPGYKNEAGQPFWASPEYCSDANALVGCEHAVTSAPISFAGLSTGVHTLGVYAYDAADNERQEEVGPNGEERHDAELSDPREFPTMYIDHTPPVIPAFGGSLVENAGGIGSGSYTLTFSAEDGSHSAPQSGVRSLKVSVDGAKVDEVATSCGEPKHVPSEGCFALAGSWGMEGARYGAGSHTVTVTATDWAGNESTRSMVVGVNEAPYEAAGPGAVNLRTGAFRVHDSVVEGVMV